MDNRLLLHDKLVEILRSPNVYYQPPANFKLSYPCVTYNPSVGDIKKASNKIYSYTNKYEVTWIFKSSKDDIIQTMLTTFPYCTIDRIFVYDKLYHYTFVLYY